MKYPLFTRLLKIPILIHSKKRWYLIMKNKKIIGGVLLVIILLGSLIYSCADEITLVLPSPKEDHNFKTKFDKMIPNLAHQLNLANTIQMDCLANQAVKVYNHQSQSINGYFESYIEVPVRQQSRFVSMIFYQKKNKDYYEIPAKKLSDTTYYIQTNLFSKWPKTKWCQGVLLSGMLMDYEYLSIQDCFKAKNYRQSKQPLFLSSQLASNQPIHLIKENRLNRIIQRERNSQQHELMVYHLTDFSLADFEHQEQNSIESMYFDYTKIDDGKIQMDFNFSYPLLKNVSYQIAMYSQINGSDDVKNYPLKQTGLKHLALFFTNHEHNHYETGYYIGYIQRNTLTHTQVSLISKQFFIPKYILKTISYKMKKIDGSRGIYALQLKVNKNERILQARFAVWTSRGNQDDLQWYIVNAPNEQGIFETMIDTRKVHFDGKEIDSLVDVEIDKNGIQRMGEMKDKISKKRVAIYVNHRGNHKCAPENSLPAFKQTKYEAVETDIHLTADQKWVIMHDDSLDRTTNGRGKLRLLTYQQLLQFHLIDILEQHYADSELKIPTLAEFLAICQSKQTIPIIEIKDKEINETAYQNLVQMVREAGFGLTAIFISFHYEPLKVVKQLMPEAEVMYLDNDITASNIKKAKHLGSRSGLNIKWQNLTYEKVSQAKSAGLQVGAWTVPASHHWQLEQMGVDYITTDD